MSLSRSLRRAVAKNSAKRPERLTRIPRDQWPADQRPGGCNRVGVWASREFLVQVFRDELRGTTRLSINRAHFGADGRWLADISWDELQAIKREIGFGDFWAVECFPPESDVVNVANMRHLWLLTEPPAYGWSRAHA